MVQQSCALIPRFTDLHYEIFADVFRDFRQYGPVNTVPIYPRQIEQPTAEADYRPLYYRDADKFEVSVVIENAAAQVIGVEVKASTTVMESDFRELKKLAEVAGEQFKMGVVLHDGTETMPMGKGLWAAPLSSLWGI